jgi:hypothetical protein
MLRLVLEPQHRESISGDLLEEYRETVRPARGRRGADLWYLRQVVGFVWATWWWGVLMGLAGMTREALDWFLPPETFYACSVATTSGRPSRYFWLPDSGRRGARDRCALAYWLGLRRARSRLS